MYWQDRMAQAQDNLTKKNIEEINKQIALYYKKSMERVIKDFENVYDKVLLRAADGKITPADLYKLDAYWKMQGALREELQKLGDKQSILLSRKFEKEFKEIYNSIVLPSQAAYSTISKEMITQMVNQIWAADGLSWSERIWKNTEQLAETLNDELLHCVVTGKQPRYLKEALQKRFGVSFNRADALVRTELAHIQTQAAQQRYVDAGIKEVMVWADKDERRCEVCGRLHKTKYPVGAAMPIPAHPRCRCCIIPVI